MKLFSIGLLALTLSLSAFAVETKVCLITTDVDAEQTEILIETDSNGDLDTIRLYKTFENKVVSDEFYPTERAVDENIIASEKGGHNVVVLKFKNFTAAAGGVITLDFLYSGISGARKELDIKLNKIAGKFVLSTIGGAKINHLLVVGNKAPLIGKLIGIKEIRASYR